MTKEMPRRYWKNLPEAVLIGPLATAARERSVRMIERAPTEPGKHVRAARASVRPLTDPPLAPGRTAEAAFARVAVHATAAERGRLLEETGARAAGCMRCPLYRDATQAVFGEGRVDAPLMFVGEQPGDREDLQGRPFVGPSGALFERALAAARIDRAQVYVTNAVKHFKFELRGQRRIHKTAAQQEAAACLDWLEQEIALVRPLAIVALGATAARSLLGRPVAVMRERGQWLRRDDGIPVLVTLHPSALLRLADGERDAAIEAWFVDFRTAAATSGAVPGFAPGRVSPAPSMRAPAAA
jgi:uracil-DNA glycosylase family protein